MLAAAKNSRRGPQDMEKDMHRKRRTHHYVGLLDDCEAAPGPTEVWQILKFLLKHISHAISFVQNHGGLHAKQTTLRRMRWVAGDTAMSTHHSVLGNSLLERCYSDIKGCMHGILS